MNIVILAAGFGKRMHSSLPKVLQPVAGKPMIRHVLERVRELEGANRVIMVVGHGMDAIRAELSDEPEIVYALQKEQLGTGDALKSALPYLLDDDKTLVLLGDVPLITAKTLSRLVKNTVKNEAGLLTVELENPTGYGRIIREDGAVSRIVEERDADSAQKAVREVNTGIMLLPTKPLASWLGALTNHNSQGEYYLTDIIPMAPRDGYAVKATLAGSALEVQGANNKAQLAKLERGFQAQIAGKLLEEGVTLADPQRIDVRGKLICASDVFIDVGCVFEGKVRLGKNVRVGPYACIKDAEIEDGTQILPFTHIDGAAIGSECRIGPFSRIRPGTSLKGGNHIGDFVELKKSEIGLNSKINHLSYIGDTDMGSGVNIGAGTITCNYDGVNKFRTAIGDKAFIGSGTQLVAPVSVGQGATIGAGSTITKDAPEDRLTLARSRQVTIEHWTRPTKKK